MKMNSNASFRVLVAAILCVSGTSSQGQQSRYGLHVGPLNSYQHGVSGDVYVVDSRTIHLRGFNYDGSGPAGYFLVGKSGVVGTDGRRIPDETGRQGALRTYRNEDITLTLPEGLTLNDISWLSVWCDDFTVNFGDIKFPRNLDYPKPKKIDPLPNLEHGVKSDRIVVVDAQTFLIPQFSYDGQAPDAFFFVGKGSKPSSSGTRVPDENGSLTPLGPYKDKTIVLTLPGDLTVYDIDYLSVWCDEYSVDFGHVKIPKSLNVPPSLRMLGVAPQGYGSSYSPRPSSSFSRPVVHHHQQQQQQPSYPPQQFHHQPQSHQPQYQPAPPPAAEYSPRPVTPQPSKQYTQTGWPAPSSSSSSSYSPKPVTSSNIYSPRPTPSYQQPRPTPAPVYQQPEPAYVHASTFHPPINTYTPALPSYTSSSSSNKKFDLGSSSPSHKFWSSSQKHHSTEPPRGSSGSRLVQFPDSQPYQQQLQNKRPLSPTPPAGSNRLGKQQKYHTILPIPVHHSVERQPAYDIYPQGSALGGGGTVIRHQQLFQQHAPQQQAAGNVFVYRQTQQQAQNQHRFQVANFAREEQLQQQQRQYDQQNDYVRDDQDSSNNNGNSNNFVVNSGHQQQQEQVYPLSNHRVRSPSLSDGPVRSINGRKPSTFTIDTGAAKSSFTLYT